MAQRTACAHCGGRLPPKGRTGPLPTYCSVQCRSIAARDIARARRVEARSNLPECRPCVVCSVPFAVEVGSTGRPKQFCSTKCSRWYRRHITRTIPRASRFVSLAQRQEIYERDGWVCQICMEPVDRKAHYLSNWFPSLDHIVPRSRGGTHDPANLRTAHRWCNSVRGDLTYYSDADLAV